MIYNKTKQHTFILSSLLLLILSGCGGSTDDSSKILPPKTQKTQALVDFAGGLAVKTPEQVINVLANDRGEQLELSCVSNSSIGGSIELSEDKLSLLYTPPNFYTGTDYFSYEIKGADNKVSTTGVTVRIDADEEYLGEAPSETLTEVPGFTPLPGIKGPIEGAKPTNLSTTPSHLVTNTWYKFVGKPKLGGCESGKGCCRSSEFCHWHRITLDYGVAYDFSVNFDNPANDWVDHYSPVVFFYDSDANIIIRDNELVLDKTFQNFKPKRTEEYYLEIRSDTISPQPFPGDDYYLVLFSIRDDYIYSLKTQGRIGGFPVIATLNYSNDNDWFKTELNNGERYRFILAKPDPTLSGSLTLTIRNSKGKALTVVDIGASNDFYYDVPGSIGVKETYYATVASRDGYTGDYRIDVEGGDIPNDLSTHATINPGGSLLGQLGSRGDYDWYKSTLSSDKTYQIRVEARPGVKNWISSPRIIIRDLNGDKLFQKGIAFKPGSTCLTDCKIYAIIDFVPPYNGEYYFSVGVEPVNRTTPGGLFNISLSNSTIVPEDDFPATDKTPAYVATRLLQKGKLEKSGDHDWFKIYKQPYEKHYITLKKGTDSSPLTDGKLELLNANGGIVDVTTLNQPDGSVLLVLESELSFGEYYIDVSSSSNSTGSYRLSHEGGDVPDDINSWMRIGLGDPVTSALNRRLDKDFFRFQLKENTVYQITATPDSSSTIAASAIDIEVFDQNQDLIYSNRGVKGEASIIDTSGIDPEQTVFIVVIPGQTSEPEGVYQLQVGDFSSSKQCSI